LSDLLLVVTSGSRKNRLVTREITYTPGTTASQHRIANITLQHVSRRYARINRGSCGHGAGSPCGLGNCPEAKKNARPAEAGLISILVRRKCQ